MGFDLVTSMTQGIEKSIVVLCCVDSEYAKSTNCMLELRHATKVRFKFHTVFCTNVVSTSSSSSDPIPRISIHLAPVLQVINERSARTRALVGVTTERDIRKWSGSDEVRDLLDINNKMYVPAAPVASR